MPTGKPLIMYNMPEIYGTRNYMLPITENKLEIARQDCLFLDENVPCDEDVFELCEILLNEDGRLHPEDPYEAADTYLYLRNQLIDLL